MPFTYHFIIYISLYHLDIHILHISLYHLHIDILIVVLITDLQVVPVLLLEDLLVVSLQLSRQGQVLGCGQLLSPLEVTEVSFWGV